MKKENINKCEYLTLLALVITLAGCSKGDGGNNDPDPTYECNVNTIFKTTDFEVYNVTVTPNANNTNVRTQFNVRNKKAQTYTPDKKETGEFMVYIKMKASDAAWYDYKYLLNNDINAGASVTSIYTFGVPVEGMTLDPTSFAYEVKCRQ